MSHSSKDEMLGENSEFLRKTLEEEQKKVNGTFPDGKLSKHDEGAMAYAVGLVGNEVVINFAKPVQSFGMTPDQAVELAKLLIQRASFSKGGSVTIEIG